MDRDTARAYIRDRLEEYLQSKGINTRKPFMCLNPAHSDNNPSMSLDRKRMKCHCFSCLADYDTFDLIGIDYGLTEPRAIFSKAYELYHIEIEDAPRKPSAREDFASNEYQKPDTIERDTHSGIHTSAYTQPAASTPAEDFTSYFEECKARIAETDYPSARGLSPEVVERFMLGFDPNYSRSTGGATWKALIIPTGKGSFVARNIDPQAEKKNRYRKTGASRIYNRKALQKAEKPIFIVEGELDALAVITAGGEAVGLGSTANYRSFLKLIETEKPSQPLIIALDNDEDGQKTAEALIEGLQKAGVTLYRLNPYGEAKDAGEALLRDGEAFRAAIESAEHIEEEAIQAEKETYFRESQVSGFIQDFIDGIADSVNTPCISTGFPRLDSALDGGLYEGLYIVGAISSLGKTTFIAQIIDQIAEAGADALLFSLEMSRAEIMAKSISRHTIKSVLSPENRKKAEAGAPSALRANDAKSARGITDGKRQINYSRKETQLIRDSIIAYSRYADRLFIREGVGNIGVEEIREAIRRHILFTGHRPIVVVDYLQILAPYSERMTDKQNTDKAVLELKRISRDYKIPVIAISSFNRVNYKEAVSMEAFKESGAIEYSSDVLIGLQLRGAGGQFFDPTKAKKRDPRIIQAVILKNRNGRVGDKLSYCYYPLFNYFIEADDQEEADLEEEEKREAEAKRAAKEAAKEAKRK